MFITICDRCGKKINFPASNGPVTIDVHGNVFSCSNDLCESCNEELLNFLGYEKVPDGHGDYIAWVKKEVPHGNY